MKITNTGLIGAAGFLAAGITGAFNGEAGAAVALFAMFAAGIVAMFEAV